MPIGTWELIIIFLAVLILFGGKKIPEIARGLGKGMREFKRAASDIQRELDLSRLDDDITKKPQPELPDKSESPSDEEPSPASSETDVTPDANRDSHDPGPEVETEEEQKRVDKERTPPSDKPDRPDDKQSNVPEDS